MFSGNLQGVQGENEIPERPGSLQSTADVYASKWVKSLAPLAIDEHTRTTIMDAADYFERASKTGNEEGVGSWVADSAASIAAGFTNPVSLTGLIAGGGIGRATTAAGVGLLDLALPKATMIAARRFGATTIGQATRLKGPDWVIKPTLGGIATGILPEFTKWTGFSLPEAMANNYDREKNTFNVWGGIREASADGGFALKIPPMIFLAGGLWGKIFGRTGRDIATTPIPMPKSGQATAKIHPDIEHIDSAVADQAMTPEEGKILKDYVTGEDDTTSLNHRATKVLIKQGHDVDGATGEVRFTIAKPSDVENMQTAFADSLANDLPEDIKNNLTNFMSYAALDTNVRANTKMLDGLLGTVHFLREKLRTSVEDTEKLKGIMKKVLPDTTSEENLITQNKLYQAEKSGVDMEATLPARVSNRLIHDRRAAKHRQTVSDYEKEYAKTPNDILKAKLDVAKIARDEHMARQPKLLSHKDEMKQIRQHLLPEGKPRENYDRQVSYARLRDLSKVRNDAERLLHELHLSHEYGKQEAYATFLEGMARVMTAETGPLAKASTAFEYFKMRAQNKIPQLVLEKEQALEKTKLQTQSMPLARAPTAEGIPSTETSGITEAPVGPRKLFNDEKLAELDAQMTDAPEEERKAYTEAKNKFKEFNENSNIFENLIKCVQGSV